jgi:hypothetical protein
MGNNDESKKIETVGDFAKELVITEVSLIGKRIGDALHLTKKEPGFLDGLGGKSDKKGILDEIAEVEKPHEINGNPLDVIAKIQNSTLKKADVVSKVVSIQNSEQVENPKKPKYKN